ncbi:MAG: T9SS type A sorting domain-containing protein [Ferruginibacter sp.]
MKNLKFSLLSLLLLFCGLANATTYYVAASGSDSNNGTSSSTPWKSLSKVQSVCNNGTVKAGDYILFNKGDVFTGSLLMASIWGYSAQSGTATSPITFSSYGTGAKPVLQFPSGGSTQVSQRVVFWFVAVNYIVVDGLNFTDLANPTNDKISVANIGYAIYLGIPDEANTNHCTIKNVDISLCGMGIAVTGDFNTIQNSTLTNFKNLINTNNGGDDDYGANAITILGSDNQILNNYISSAWAYSSDFGWNGGACEMYNTCDRNKIMYNTIVDCDGVSEFGGQGGTTAADNLFAYNKIINCGQLTWVNSSGTFAMQGSNVQYFNNVVVENNLSRFSGPNVGAGNTHPLAHYPMGNLFGFSGTPDASVVFNLKNNIFILSTGIDVTGSSYASRTTHQDNIYQLSNNSVPNFTLGTTELSTSAAILTNTTAADPQSWDYTPITGSPAIDFGQNLGLTKDFAGNIVPAVPNAGILETGTSGAPTLAVTSSATTISCNGGTATVTVSATGGTAPYTGTGTFTVSAGTYSYTVIDAVGIVSTTSLTVAEPTAISVTATPGSILIFGGNTSVTVNATGGTSPYTYSITGGIFQSSNIFTTILAGTYTVTVKDNKGCTATKTITISQPGAPTQFAASSTAGTISCNGGTTTVTVSASGGTTPYAGTGTFTVSAGTYTYSVTDATGAVRNTSVTVTQPAVLTLSAAAGTITIFGNTTTITLTAGGGTTAYTYSLDGGSYQSSNIFSNVAAGSHTVTVKDARGCTAAKTITISQPTQVVASSTQASAINCNGGTATVTVSATGGTTPYTGTGTFTVTAGTYTYTVTDAAGAVKTTTITVAQPTAITASVNAPGVYSASAKTTVTVTATGGTPGYSYSLDNGTYQSSNVFQNVAVGNHSVRIKDTKACVLTNNFTVSLLTVYPLVVSASAGFINCNGGTTTVTVSATGGIAPYTGTGTFTVSAGTTTFTVTDAAGTVATKSITVVQPKPIIVSVATGTITVNGGSTTATVTASGGTGAYTYQLNSGSVQSSNVFTNVTAGTYTVTVKDVRNCTGTKTFTLTQPAPVFHITLVSKTNVSCSGANNGSIKVAGANGTSPYQYKKNNGNYSSNSTFNNLAPGNYTMTCKDATGATSSMQVNIANSTVACRPAEGKGNTANQNQNAIVNTDSEQAVTGLEVSVFPNPTTTQFSLIAKSDNDATIHITVMNMNGQRVYENNSTVNSKIVFGNSFVPGIYFVKVVQGERVHVTKLIKIK